MKLLYLVESNRSWMDVANTIEDWLGDRYEANMGWHRVSSALLSAIKSGKLPRSFSVCGIQLIKVGKGSTRYVYRVRGTNCVVKMTCDPYFNKREFNRYRNASSASRRYLARALAISKRGYVIVMEYVPKKAAPSDEQTVNQALPHVMDIGNSNIRRTLNDHPKVVDYEW